MPKKIITSDDILGKDAVDTDGQVLGVVMKIHIDKESKKITGITIDQGFMKPDLFIGLSYIRNFGIDSVFISRVPASKFKGLKVLAHDGKDLGTVAEARSERHRLSGITVSQGGISRKKFSVKSSEIAEIGDNIILKKGFRKQRDGSQL